MGVGDLKYFQTKSEPSLRKILLLIAKTIIEDIVVKIKRLNVYRLSTDELSICLAFINWYVNWFHLLSITVITKREQRKFLLIFQIF